MSPQSDVESAVYPAADEQPYARNNAQGQRTRSAAVRLTELQRALQRQLRRKPTEFEKTALDRAALLTLRAEMAALDPKADSNDIVRLDNCASRARAAFARMIAPKRKPRSMADIEKELASHV